MAQRRESREHYARWFAALFDTYGAPLARLASSYARARGEQDDLFQEIMIALWRALPAYRGDCSERTYVYRIAHNRAMSYLSRRRPMVGNLDEEGELPAPGPDARAGALARRRGRAPCSRRRVPPGWPPGGRRPCARRAGLQGDRRRAGHQGEQRRRASHAGAHAAPQAGGGTTSQATPSSTPGNSSGRRATPYHRGCGSALNARSAASDTSRWWP